MSFASATARFNRHAFRHRTQTWPIAVMVAAIPEPITAAKSPTELKRVQNDQGAGWVQQAHAVFHFAGDGAYAPGIGAEFTIATSELADEVGTAWRCYDLKRANPATSADHRCVCFRLD